MLLIEHEMPVNKAAGTLQINPQRLWNIFNYWLNRAHLNDDQSSVNTLGIDETSSKRGHDYITLAVYLFENPYTAIFGAQLFEEEIFFLINESQTNLSIISHGILAED